jgi:hypothetical protein
MTMTAAMTPNEVAQNLINLTRELNTLVREYRQLGDDAATAKSAYEVAYARAYLTNSGPVEERKQKAIGETADHKFKADLAERRVAACKEAIRACHARLDVGRTLSATVRDELKTLGVEA